ncbi:MAG: sulfite exporter TauE/SafE family protein [Fibrobacteria bacterium]|nr:sulfite exporter TauE/SafE family protein [Fibrobacteria bacterium]
MNAIFLAVGVGAGILSGLFGIGGGSLIVPALIALAGMDVLHASATSLAALLLPVGALGVWQYHKSGLVQWKVAGWLSAGLLMGSALGAAFALSLPSVWLERGYAAFLLYIAQGYLEVGKRLRGATRVESDPGPRRDGANLVWLATGFAAGIIAGLFGKGGGVVIVPILMFFYAYRAKEATGTSLAALQLPVGLPGVVMYARSGVLDLQLAGWVAAGLVVGTLFGTRIAIGLDPKLFKKLYGFFLLGVSLFLILR